MEALAYSRTPQKKGHRAARVLETVRLRKSTNMGEQCTTRLPLVLGLNAAYHETAAAIVRGSEVIFAAEEERYTREKHGKPARVTNPDQLPWHAIHDCLRAAGCRKLSDVDAVAYSLAPGSVLA